MLPQFFFAFVLEFLVDNVDEEFEAKKIILFFPKMRVTKKFLTWAAAKKIFIDLIEFFNQSLHFKNNPNSTFLC